MSEQIDSYNKILQNTVDIYSSREEIRSQLTTFAQEYLELRTVDLYKTSFLSYIIDILSILTANQMFYSSTIYREFFIVTAQFRESVLNLSKWIGYIPDKAIPSTADVQFTIPLTFSAPGVSFAIPSDFVVKAGDIKFLVDSNPSSTIGAEFKRNVDPEDPTKPKDISSTAVANTTVEIINNNAITVRDSNGFNRPVSIDYTNNTASFVLPFTQHTTIVKQFLIPDSLEFYQFYSTHLKFDGMYSDIEVYVREPIGGEQLAIEDEDKYIIVANENQISSQDYSLYGYKESHKWAESESGLYTLTSTSKEYVWGATEDEGDLLFGNGVLGRQPSAGSKVLVVLHITQGEDGQVIPGTINTGSSLYYLAASSSGALTSPTTNLLRISYSVSNAYPSSGGVNTPTLAEIKHRAIVNLRAKKRLVSSGDYDDINEIMGSNFPVIESQPILKRSDIKVNEIMAFMRLIYHDSDNMPEIVPTRNANIEILDPTFVDSKHTVNRKESVTIDGFQYESMFNITINQKTKVAYYDYVLSNLFDTPAQLSPSQPFYDNQQYIGQSYIPLTTIDFTIDTEAVYDDTSSSSGSEVVDTGKFPLIITTHVNHIPSTEIRLFRMKIKTKWGNLDEYVTETEVVPDYDTDYELDSGVFTNRYKTFTLTLPDYRDVPAGTQRIEYTTMGYVVDTGWVELQKYYTDTIIRQDLSDVMISTVTSTRMWDGVCHDDAMWTIHNVPVIFSDYLDDGAGGGVYNTASQRNFELAVIQNLINNLDMNDKRMLTDFINVKFPDTHGILYNLKYNPVDHIVSSRYITPFNDTAPDGFSSSSSSSIEAGTKFIVNGPVPGYEDIDLTTYINHIAELKADGGWLIHVPENEDYIRVEDEYDSQHDQKIYAFSGARWVDVQIFTIPIDISAKIRVSSNANVSYSGLVQEIKELLIEKFTPKMGMNRPLDRSEIIKVIRDVDYVTFCDLLTPEINIRFDYDIEDLSQKQLLDYTPQYVGFSEGSIDIEILGT